jgi:hypothetical protein
LPPLPSLSPTVIISPAGSEIAEEMAEALLEEMEEGEWVDEFEDSDDDDDDEETEVSTDDDDMPMAEAVSRFNFNQLYESDSESDCSDSDRSHHCGTEDGYEEFEEGTQRAKRHLVSHNLTSQDGCGTYYKFYLI